MRRLGRGRWSLYAAAVLAALVGGSTRAFAELPVVGHLLAPAGSTGYDISWPQCPSSSFPGGGQFRIVGVDGGKPFTANPCLTAEYRSWAALLPSTAFYINTADPGPVSGHWGLPGPRPCLRPASRADTGCAYDYGWNGAADSFARTVAATSPLAAQTADWWLDVETENSWSGTAAANAADLSGAIDYLRSRAVPHVGVYSTRHQWGIITRGVRLGPGILDWVAGASSLSQASSWCSAAHSFSGGPVAMVQYPSGPFDGDVRCPSPLLGL